MSIEIGVGNLGKTVNQIYVGYEDAMRQVSEVYIGVNGTPVKVFPSVTYTYALDGPSFNSVLSNLCGNYMRSFVRVNNLSEVPTPRYYLNRNGAIDPHPIYVGADGVYNVKWYTESQKIKITNGESMFTNLFFNTAPISYLDLTDFDVSECSNMNFMFSVGTMGYDQSPLQTIDISTWNTANVTSTMGMFMRLVNLQTIYVSNKWSVNNVSRSNSMFSQCSSLPNYDSSVTDKTRAYYGGNGYLTLKT